MTNGDAPTLTLEHDVSTLPRPSAERIAVKSRAGIFVLRLQQIDWVEANQDYAALHVGAKSWLIRDSMRSLASRWAPAGFVRIHRSTLLNADRVRELRPLSKGEFTVVLCDGTELKLSRSYRGAIPALARGDTAACGETPKVR